MSTQLPPSSSRRAITSGWISAALLGRKEQLPNRAEFIEEHQLLGNNEVQRNFLLAQRAQSDGGGVANPVVNGPQPAGDPSIAPHGDAALQERLSGDGVFGEVEPLGARCSLRLPCHRA